MTDEEFLYALNMLKFGNKDGLRSIYEAYMKLIFAVVYDTVKNREEAEDITSEFFIKLIRAAGSYKAGNGHRAWLVTIARNMAIDSIRKNKKSVSMDMEEDGNAVLTGSEGIEDASIAVMDIEESMKQLKTSEKEIVDMKLVGGMTFKEISDAVKKPMGTVTWLYNQGIKKLRGCLKGYDK